MRISNSFSEGEIQVLDFICSTLLRGGTPTMAVRSKDFASVCRKVQAMKTRVGEIKAGGGKAPRGAVPAESSVGVIEGAGEAAVEESGDDLRDVG
jgi:hypothetical protein